MCGEIPPFVEPDDLPIVNYWIRLHVHFEDIAHLATGV